MTTRLADRNHGVLIAADLEVLSAPTLAAGGGRRPSTCPWPTEREFRIVCEAPTPDDQPDGSHTRAFRMDVAQEQASNPTHFRAVPRSPTDLGEVVLRNVDGGVATTNSRRAGLPRKERRDYGARGLAGQERAR